MNDSYEEFSRDDDVIALRFEQEEGDCIGLLARTLFDDYDYNEWQSVPKDLLEKPAEFMSNDHEYSHLLEYIQQEPGDLTNVFIAYADGFALKSIDFKGEDSEGSLARFVSEKVSADSKLNERLTAITAYAEIEQVCTEPGDLYIYHVVDRIQQLIQPLGYTMGNLNVGCDTYFIFVTTHDNFALIESIDNSNITVMNCIG